MGSQKLKVPATPYNNLYTRHFMLNEAPILWSPDVNNRLIGKDPDAGKDRRQEKWAVEDEMVGRHCRHNGHEFEQTPGDSGGQRSLACCSPWGPKELDMT